MDFAVNETPQAIEDTLNLTQGSAYTLSNASPDEVVFYRLASAAPAAGAAGHALRPYRDIVVEPDGSAEKTFFWTLGPSATVVVTEEAD